MNAAGPHPNGSGRSRVLLTGATGYVGGRLLGALEEAAVPVRCLTRRPAGLRSRVATATQVVRGDLMVEGDSDLAFEGIDTAFYLVHSMGAGAAYAEMDRVAATNFAAAARAAGVRRIVYLGGLGEGTALSKHLASRQEVGRILSSAGVPMVELRSSIIIGSGSLSFELIRSLVERLPVMITPSWVRTLTQPIAIDDVIAALVAAMRIPVDGHRILEIGGPDRVSYGDLMGEYARQCGLRHHVIPVPVLTPRLSSLWLGLVTPVYARVGRELLEGVRNETTINDDSGLRALGVTPRGVTQAIREAIADQETPKSRWSDVLPRWIRPASHGIPLRRQMVDSRWVRVEASPEAAFAPIQRIGGRRGWYYGNGMWRVRGWLDLAFGGIGMRRGRRHPVDLAPGDAVDFWRVEAIEPARMLRLAAEMRLPGRAWLQFRVEADESGSIIRQTAFFEPHGLFGRLYWYALVPAHQFVFRGMLRGIAAAVAIDVGPPHPSGPPRSRSMLLHVPANRPPANRNPGRRRSRRPWSSNV